MAGEFADPFYKFAKAYSVYFLIAVQLAQTSAGARSRTVGAVTE
jgi:hypothetical protein